MLCPYCYRGTDVLKNKLGIRDKETLSEMERTYTATRTAQLKESPIKGSFDMEHLQKIHKRIFQDVYAWAGQTRNVNILKTSDFCLFQHIDAEQTRIFGGLQKENHLKGLDLDQFSKRAAYYLGEINALHPFREGNGRTQREFMHELAHNAGYKLELNKVSQKQMIDASIAAYHGKYEGLEKTIKENLTPLEIRREITIKDFENAPAIKDLPKNPHSKTLFQAYAKETLAENGHTWSEKTNQIITEKMLLKGVSPNAVKTALKHSPDKINNIHVFLREIQNKPEIKALQKTKGLTMSHKR